MTDAFRQMFPNLPSIAATEVQLLSGGNSKRILAVTLKDSGDLPSQMIVRQDVSLGADTSVASEYPVIQQFAGKGFPIPECYRLELRETAIGSNFLLMQRMPGAAISDSYDVSGVSPAIAHDIARTIARLHQFDPRDFTFLAHSNCTDAGAAFLAQLAYYRQQWRNKALIPSPIVEYAYAWLEREAQSGLGAPTIVHGDLSPFNFLADQERVTALLDWEFVHIGDPVEDIAYIKPSIEQIVPWDDFMATYVAHGGRSVDAHQIKIFSVWASVRNTALAAGVISDLVAGRTTEFGPAAMGFGAFKMLEEQAFAALFG
jgi:aminoglycoside phosphotransferase (APT) family kinase protein